MQTGGAVTGMQPPAPDDDAVLSFQAIARDYQQLSDAFAAQPDHSFVSFSRLWRAQQVMRALVFCRDAGFG